MEIPSKEILLKLYRDLLTARRVESEIWTSAREFGTASGSSHRGPGEECIPIAICNNLTETDCFHPNFRTAFCLFTKPPFTLRDSVRMSLGRPTDKIPWFTPKYGGLGSSGTLGEPSVRYVGAAAAAAMKKTGDIVVFVQGDGASNRAPTHEAMATAAAWNLPIVFVIQNNKYGMGTSVKTSYNIEDLSVRGAGYGFPHERVDGNDMIEMYLVAKKHIERVRAGGGPSLIAADTWRMRSHFEGDPEIYRPKGEREDWQKFDPLPRYQKQLQDFGLLTEADVEKMENDIAMEIKELIDEVRALPAPDPAEAVKRFMDTAIDGL